MLNSEQRRMIVGATKARCDRIVVSPNQNNRNDSPAMFCRDVVVAGKRLQSEGRLFRSARSTKSLHEFASGEFSIGLQGAATIIARLGPDKPPTGATYLQLLQIVSLRFNASSS